MKSLRKAINDKCKSCTFREKGIGTWKQQVSMCPVFDCPLWEVRPVYLKWGKSLPLHDKKEMEVYRGLSIDSFYKMAVKASGEGNDGSGRFA